MKGATFHGLTGSPTHRVWTQMRARCFNTRRARYEDWGGRGITVCARWCEPRGRGFLNFLEDMGERPPGRKGLRPLYTLDRIDNEGNYEPGNCRWATYAEQAQSRRRRRS